MTLSEWAGEGEIVVDLEGHGREEILEAVDTSRTVGWFTSLYPVKLTVAPGRNPEEALKATKETLRRIPRRGCGTRGVLG